MSCCNDFAAVSCLCGVLTRKKTPPASPDNEGTPKRDDGLTTGGSGGASSSSAATPQDKASIATSTETTADPPGADQQQQMSLPPPPGADAPKMTRTTSCQHQRSFSMSSSASKLLSSMSMRAVGAKQKILKQEDSIWKKTIILGEKCRVPDEDEDSIVYDERGNKISTYHPKTHSGVLSFSRQASSVNHDQDNASKK